MDRPKVKVEGEQGNRFGHNRWIVSSIIYKLQFSNGSIFLQPLCNYLHKIGLSRCKNVFESVNSAKDV